MSESSVWVKYKETFVNALEAIQKMDAKIAELEKVSRWIPVTERLPENDSHYLCAYRSYDGNYMVRIEYFMPKMIKFPTDITHWRELPLPPEKP